MNKVEPVVESVVEPVVEPVSVREQKQETFSLAKSSLEDLKGFKGADVYFDDDIRRRQVSTKHLINSYKNESILIGGLPKKNNKD